MNCQVESEDVNPQDKKAFLEEAIYIQKELEKCQREYKKIVSKRLRNRTETILDKSYDKQINRYLSERNDLRAQLWVSEGKSHTFENDRRLDLVKCHIRCQEHLSDDIRKIKVYINHVEQQMSLINRKIYELNRKTVPDSQHQDYVKHMRKKMSILENRLEVGIRRESGFTAANAVLREELKTLLDYRQFFIDSYMKLIYRLTADKKYMLELLKFSYNMFEDCINVSEKIDHMFKKSTKERDNIKADIQGIIRKTVASDEVFAFNQVKNQVREWAPLNPKECKRREEFRLTHERKIDLYNNVLEKLLTYTNTSNIDEVIETFQNQESAYYSYYNLTIETGFNITILQNAVNRLYAQIGLIRNDNSRKSFNEIDKIAGLKALYQAKKRKNDELRNEIETKDRVLESFFQDFTSMFNLAGCNAAPIMLLLGDNTKVSVHNLKTFLKIFEKRLCQVLAALYVKERDDLTKDPEKYVVKEILKTTDSPTNLDDIVLTQQCPECAESEAYNMDDIGGEGVNVHTIEHAKKLLYEKVNQPEMQYRLHSLSQCRLPRSMLLTAKRHE